MPEFLLSPPLLALGAAAIFGLMVHLARLFFRYLDPSTAALESPLMSATIAVASIIVIPVHFFPILPAGKMYGGRTSAMRIL